MLEGRRGHARIVVMTVTDEEREAARAEFGAIAPVEVRTAGLACWTPDHSEDHRFGVLVSQSMGRSNILAGQSAQHLIEDWRPEVLVVVGTAAAIARAGNDGSLSGLDVGDVVCIEYVHYAEFAKYNAGRREPRYFPVQHPDGLLLASEVRHVQTSADWHVGLVERPTGDARWPTVEIGELVAVEVIAGDGHAAGQQDLLAGFDHAIALDMESAGVARTMHTASDNVHYRPTWLGIRGVSDRTAADSGVESLLGENNAERKAWTPYAAAAAARFAHRLVERILKYERLPSSDPGAPGWPPSERPNVGEEGED